MWKYNLIFFFCKFIIIFFFSFGGALWKELLYGRSRTGIDIFLFVEHPVFNVFNVKRLLILDCWFYFVTSYLNSTCKTFLLWKFYVFCKRSNDIDMAPWNWPESLVYFDLPLITRILYIKHTNCENSRSAAKEASLLLLSWSNLSIISSKWQLSWILIDLYLSLLLNLSLKLIYCENFRCFEK